MRSTKGGAWTAQVGLVMLALLILTPGLAKASDENGLSGREISEILSGAVIEGTGPQAAWRQIFYPDGRTIYREKDQGRDSRGEWQVNGDQFCSLWPPASDWDCYRVTGSDDTVTFIPLDGGDPWPAKITGGTLL